MAFVVSGAKSASASRDEMGLNCEGQSQSCGSEDNPIEKIGDSDRGKSCHERIVFGNNFCRTCVESVDVCSVKGVSHDGI